jgi:hypothetical protein
MKRKKKHAQRAPRRTDKAPERKHHESLYLDDFDQADTFEEDRWSWQEDTSRRNRRGNRFQIEQSWDSVEEFWFED